MTSNTDSQPIIKNPQFLPITPSKRPILPLVLQNYQLPQLQRAQIENRAQHLTSPLQAPEPQRDIHNSVFEPQQTLFSPGDQNNNMNRNPKQSAKGYWWSNNILFSCPWWVYVMLGSFVFVFLCFTMAFSILNNINVRHRQEIAQVRPGVRYTVLTEKCGNGLFAYKGKCIKCPTNYIQSDEGCVMPNSEPRKVQEQIEQPRAHFESYPYRMMSHYEDYPNHEGLFRAVRGAGRGVYGGAASVARGARRVTSGVWRGAERLTRSIL